MSKQIKINREIEDSQFSVQLKHLMLITRQLRSYSSYTIILLVFSLIFLTLVSIYRRQFSIGYDLNILTLGIWMYSLLNIIMGIFILYKFSAIRKQGMIIYEELTEEIDWSSKRKEFIHRPPIETRIVIKEFLQASDLPFTSGANGQAFYLIMYVILSILTIFLMVVF